MAWEFPNLISGPFVLSLIAEGLVKYSHGDPKVEFSVPIHWFDELEIFHNIRIQDPQGLSSSGAGEKGRYYYIETLDYDFMADQIHVVAVDLQFVLGRWFIAGDRDLLAADWSSAGEADRMFAYAADETTKRFADGSPGKKAADESML